MEGWKRASERRSPPGQASPGLEEPVGDRGTALSGLRAAFRSLRSTLSRPRGAGSGSGALSDARGRLSGTCRGLSACDFRWKIGVRGSGRRQFQGSGGGKDPSEGNRGPYEIQLGFTAKKIDVEEYEIPAAPRDAGCREVMFVLSRVFFDSPRGLIRCDGAGTETGTSLTV